MDALSWVTLVTGLVAGLGIGSVLTAAIQHVLSKRSAVYESQRQDLEKRYRVIILLMYAAVDYDGNATALRINRPDLTSKEDVLEDLKAEWYNMLLFASEHALTQLPAFIDTPTKKQLGLTAIAMRQDLGRSKIRWVPKQRRLPS